MICLWSREQVGTSQIAESVKQWTVKHDVVCNRKINVAAKPNYVRFYHLVHRGLDWDAAGNLEIIKHQPDRISKCRLFLNFCIKVAWDVPIGNISGLDFIINCRSKSCSLPEQLFTPAYPCFILVHLIMPYLHVFVQSVASDKRNCSVENLCVRAYFTYMNKC